MRHPFPFFIFTLFFLKALSQTEILLSTASDTTKGFEILGPGSDSLLGSCMSNAGDINNDGIDDIIIGAPVANPSSLNNAGIVYVIYGKAGGVGNIDLSSTLNLAKGFKVSGGMAADQVGYSVGPAGDVNNDGIDDVIMGAKYAHPSSRTGAGTVYVIYGKQGGLTAHIDLSTTLPLSVGIEIYGAGNQDWIGTSVGTAGDINGDNIDDFVFGAIGFDPASPARTDAGRVYVIYGQTGNRAAHIDLNTDFSTSIGFRINGGADSDNLGCSVASAGDVNKDGHNDIIIAACGASPAGSAYVIYGTASFTRSNIDLNTGLALTNGFMITGAVSGQQLGYSVSSAGDVNDDNIDDIIIGANLVGAGAAYVIYGQNGNRAAHVTLSSGLALSDGFQITGAASGDGLGSAVRGIGDINQDGAGDIIVGAPLASPSGLTNAGAAYVIYGKTGGLTANVDLSTTLQTANGFKISGATAGDKIGYSVAFADLNNDGADDVVVGEKFASPSTGTTAGAVGALYSTLVCKVDNCTACVAGSATVCDTCDTGYAVTLSGTVCELICQVNNCTTCVAGSATVCDTCDTGYSLGLGGTVCNIICQVNYCNTCVTGSGTVCGTCNSGYSVNLAGTCDADPIATNTDIDNKDEIVDTITTAQSTASQVSALVASAITLINFKNPGGLLFGALAETLQYMKYMSIAYPPKLQQMLDESDVPLLVIEYISAPPPEIEIRNYTLVKNFDKYGFHSSFLINFWSSLSSLVIAVIAMIVFCLCVCLTRSCKAVSSKFVHFKEALKWNYLIGSFADYYGPIAFYTSFELRTLHLDSLMEIVSLSVCGLINIISAVILLQALNVTVKISREKDPIEQEKRRYGYRDYRIIFESFKDSSFSQLNYFGFSCLRIYFFYTILSLMFEYPLIQAIIFNAQGSIFLLYLLLQRPLKEKLDLLLSVVLELILLVVHGSVLGLAIIDETKHVINDIAILLGNVIIGCNSMFVVIQCIYLLLQFILIVISFYKSIKTKLSQTHRQPLGQRVSPVTRTRIRLTALRETHIDVSMMNESHDLIKSGLRSTDRVNNSHLVSNAFESKDTRLLSETLEEESKDRYTSNVEPRFGALRRMIMEARELDHSVSPDAQIVQRELNIAQLYIDGNNYPDRRIKRTKR